ncbi:hypothetical protein ALNOE001_20080 [Candidatus Methanobinarius endosymbioticus]|uniref:Right handed beta helix domain-containing protein n=1 Tax=Candidatus Methanobinarius endosymbioticus TaxID=2006182 RepID=A0A366M7R1_9EURY|nr:hypothetical protein ALNOE001_20080 [Candidatus Methanobinarius endosymbioticus]
MFNNNNTNFGGGCFIYSKINLSNNNFANNNFTTIYTLNDQITINKNRFNTNDAVLGIGFNDSTVNLNNFLINYNTFLNNGIMLVFDGNRNNINHDNILNNGTKKGILINGNNNKFINLLIVKLSNIAVTFNNFASGNNFTNGTVTENGYGFLILGNNNCVMSSTILANRGYGFNISGK